MNDFTKEHAKNYSASKKLDFRSCIERFTFFSIIGDDGLKGKTAVDFACGDGAFAGNAAARGVKSVTGYDASDDMINMARRNNAGRQECEFRKRDLLDSTDDKDEEEKCDFVFANYIFNLAKSVEELRKLTKSAASYLKKDAGTIIGVNNNPFNTSTPTDDYYRKYGFCDTWLDPDLNDGSKINTRVFDAEGKVALLLEYYYFKPETYEEAFLAAGFKDFRWHKVRVSPEEEANEHWKDFLRRPPIIIFTAKM